jgi:hypothetical protein
MATNWIRPPAETAFKISGESARAEVERLLEFYQADFSDLPEERQKAVNEILDTVCKAFRRGALEIKAADGDIHVIQHLESGTDLEYRPFTGKIRAKLDSAGDAIYQKIYLCLGLLSGLGEDVYRGLKGSDLKISEAIGSLFLVL